LSADQAGRRIEGTQGRRVAIGHVCTRRKLRRPGGVGRAYVQIGYLRTESRRFEDQATVKRKSDGLLWAEHERVGLLRLCARAPQKEEASGND
jgi:hypothetical protein